ncbi:hypothetical protein M670_00669 [Schinkia azotoformans MEV2011]|uniref:Uncharacterized protein n=1 Tax=Schinkia azotoformans MEV2011 TaxID=1348973 RepID=A0A072NS04_SCHAZ|nr:hypothetical protein [Schinkia azotoformans]KEF39648.1 hypothetical protein M670_00669 [Schinkia azotoformans MEV2011]MEC1695079.1 hypothetical protein [Schinkia azotoformans]MEC1726884.1 hypothetical protein [Schinkia azotoformans]
MKYTLYQYWNSAVFEKNLEVWAGCFENQIISEETVFLNVIIVNPYSNQNENSWVAYPTIFAALGFIKYIYLPTAIYGFFEKEVADAGRIIEENMENYLQYQLEASQSVSQELITELQALFPQVDKLFSCSKKECFDELKRIGKQLNKITPNERYAYFYFYLFFTPKEVGEFLVDSYISDEMLGIETLEEDLGVSKEEWIAITSHVYENEFMRRRFTDILTNRLVHSL